MKLPESWTKVTLLSKIIAMALFVSLPFIGFVLGMKYQEDLAVECNSEPINNTTKDTTPPEKSDLNSKETSSCIMQGLQPKDNFLITYIVKSGDSLLSISKSQLGDISRVNEIISLNMDQYPHLSLNQPFLEQGWKLYLPPQALGITNGHVYLMGGNIKFDPNNPDIWGIKWPKGQGGSFSMEEINQYSKYRQLEEGDCVSVLYQGGDNQKIFSITLQ